MDAPILANVIAALAFLVSIAAAVFSWRSAAQAKRTNKIALHQYQKELHLAFFEVRKLLVTRGVVLKQDDLRSYGFIFRSSSLYVSALLSKRLLDFYEECFQVEQLHINLESFRDDFRILNNDPRLEEDESLKRLRASAHSSVASARQDLTNCIDRASTLAVDLDALFMTELKLQ